MLATIFIISYIIHIHTRKISWDASKSMSTYRVELRHFTKTQIIDAPPRRIRYLKRKHHSFSEKKRKGFNLSSSLNILMIRQYNLAWRSKYREWFKTIKTISKHKFHTKFSLASWRVQRSILGFASRTPEPTWIPAVCAHISGGVPIRIIQQCLTAGSRQRVWV